MALLAAAGCIEVSLDGLLPAGSPFVVRGTATILDNDGPCPAWIGENGVTYHLFQDPFLDNATFDRITTPGTTSRLLLVTRDDLVLGCQLGTIVEVEDVLEVVD